MAGGLEIHLSPQVAAQVHHPVQAEARKQPARIRVQRHQTVGRSDQEYLSRFPVAPERDPPAGCLPRRRLPTLPLVETIGPERFPSAGVDRQRRPPRAGGDIDHPVQHQWGSAQVQIGPRAEVPRSPAPGDLQLVHVAGVDLIQRGVAGRGQVRRVVRPFPGFPFLTNRGGAGEPQRCRQPDQPPEYQIR